MIEQPSARWSGRSNNSRCRSSFTNSVVGRMVAAGADPDRLTFAVTND